MNKKQNLFSCIVRGITIINLLFCFSADARWIFGRRKNKKKLKAAQALQQQVDAAHVEAFPERLSTAKKNASGSAQSVTKSPEEQNRQMQSQIQKQIQEEKEMAQADLALVREQQGAQEKEQALQAELLAQNQHSRLNNNQQEEKISFDEHQLELPLEFQPTPEPILLEKSEAELEVEEQEEQEKIEFQFEDADLQVFVAQIGQLFDVDFITDEMIQPMPSTGKAIKNNKISFKTNKPLSRQQAWDLFITFLEIAGFAPVQQADPTLYRIEVIDSARRSPIPAFIGVNSETLPDNDALIRYVYFIENSTLDVMKAIIEPLKSPVSAPLILLKEHKAFILTDKAYNIKTLMKIVKELDKVSMPQSMSVLKLKRADAVDVKKLYDELMVADSPEYSSRLFSARKQPTSLFLPENTTLIAEPRTNSLILLGPPNAIQKIEDFIVKNIDIDLQKPYSPLRDYQLKYADAENIAKIMNDLTKFGKDSPVGKAGGIRGQDRYLKDMVFTPEPMSNRLIIKGDEQDYLMALEIIEKLDKQQPQIAIEVLIVGISVGDQKQLGAQIRSKDQGPNGLIGNNVKFQTSGLFQGKKVVTNPNADRGVARLLGDLVELALGASPGNTILSLGSDAFGVWGIFQALQSVSNAQIISNPFLVATNKTPATISLGETRRVQTGLIAGTTPVQTFSDDTAKLEVKITPQINSDGMILLNLDITIVDFTNPDDPSSATKDTRKITTSTIVADKEVLALGGLIRNTINDGLFKTPLLGDIPVLGWLFKNKSKRQSKENLLILISTQIIEPGVDGRAQKYTQNHIDGYRKTLSGMVDSSERRDPIHKMFFAGEEGGTEQVVESFLFKRAENGNKKGRKKNKKSKRVKYADAKRDQKISTPLMAVAEKNLGFKKGELPVNSAEKIALNKKKAQEKKITGNMKVPTSSKVALNKQKVQAPKIAYNVKSPDVGTVAMHKKQEQSQELKPTKKIGLKNKKRSNLSLTNLLSNTDMGLRV